jgi:hypothetical protein
MKSFTQQAPTRENFAVRCAMLMSVTLFVTAAVSLAKPWKSYEIADDETPVLEVYFFGTKIREVFVKSGEEVEISYDTAGFPSIGRALAAALALTSIVMLLHLFVSLIAVFDCFASRSSFLDRVFKIVPHRAKLLLFGSLLSAVLDLTTLIVVGSAFDTEEHYDIFCNQAITTPILQQRKCYLNGGFSVAANLTILRLVLSILTFFFALGLYFRNNQQPATNSTPSPADLDFVKPRGPTIYQ